MQCLRQRCVSRFLHCTSLNVGRVRISRAFSDRTRLDDAPEGVTLVRDEESAHRVVAQLMGPLRGHFHACDTEVVNIDLKLQGPVGNGEVSCVSIYCGPDVDFGNGPNLWIENFLHAKCLPYFKDYFADQEIKKVWHNYSFDRHVLFNHGLDVQGFGGDTMHMARLWRASPPGGVKLGAYSLEGLSNELLDGHGKISMKKLFGTTKLDVAGWQVGEDTRKDFINYSCLDARATWELRQHLEGELRNMEWQKNKDLTMYDFYVKWWLPFGHLLTDIERAGIFRNEAKVHTMVEAAAADQQRALDTFMLWAAKISPDACYMNPNSRAQVAHLLFGKRGEPKAFSRDNTEGYIRPGKVRPIKSVDFELIGQGMKAVSLTKVGKTPKADTAAISMLAGDLGAEHKKWGQAYSHFGKGVEGEDACIALDGLLKHNFTSKMLSTFIKPLITLADPGGRIHCSMNLNTETGRLSARQPNLQNQPALEKDVYKVRDTFEAEPGNTLIVADYGQLELRILAHMTQCQSMLEAFKLGGDFHSRTAMGMFDYIKADLDSGQVLLEWDEAKGPPPVPLLKNKYASERRKAKTLNFSIAYGKTVHGLSSDWGVTVKEAQATLDAWFSDRPEVLAWQETTKNIAKKHGTTRTLMGRYRPLRGAQIKNHFQQQALRAAINTPIQGGAADIVMAAMLKLGGSARFRQLGWRMILQVHDEIISEGPEESKEEAMAIVLDCMQNPLDAKLLVDLTVDANMAKTWYEAK